MADIKTIVIGADHAGYKLKNELASYLRNFGYVVIDKGGREENPDNDYPDFIFPTAQAVADDPEHSRGIVIGGTGEGEAIAANRIKGIRAAVYYGYNIEILKLSREHNDANILSLGARFVSTDEAKAAVLLWLETPFSRDARHIRRIAKLDK